MASDDDLWYKDAIFYELHVKAFQDGNGDGTGDFQGLISRLDYLQDLGIDCIWLLPFYPSPLRDDGYDIAEYLGINPRYGDLDDAKEFLDEAHRRGIRVIADLVLNHTSDQHVWFQRARRAPRGSPEREWYVWRDDDTGYPDARIIFTDNEPSNWSWDPVAEQYYWHRFFSHQPDLNWDNPLVKETMFQVMEYWLDMGLDGFRADAVPYLIEREGTNCENLPETHAILREFRARMESRYPDRILLAEANQWPADVRAYFGDSDEFHMAFHFPLMPRLFMAVRQGSRTPIVEVIENTPPIPEDCQWCMFLRNHDELTLEMVTDEERDYMYQEYAADPRMRLNLGIRRRLAPLMDGDRRKVELLNSILLTMPGTPTLYYGDEIGMGDNIWLGDRDGVRTPMQWSPDRNAGFSRAEPERLYLPVISDSVYGYQAVNVDAQRRSPYSLLNWMKRLIRVRKQHLALGRGRIEFLKPENPHILAYVREHGDDLILVVGNLAATAQPVQLDLSRFEGRMPVELLGATPFLTIGPEPYALTLAPFGCFWFALRPSAASGGDPDEEDLERLSRQWEEAERDVIGNAESVAKLVAELSPEWLNAQRWFRGKSRDVTRIECFDSAAYFPERGLPVLLTILRVDYDMGDPEYYLLPLAPRPPARPGEGPAAILTVSTMDRDLSLYEGMGDPGSAFTLLGLIDTETELEAGLGVFRGVKSSRYEEFVGALRPVGSIMEEQSNTSVQFGEVAVMKIFRKLESGVHPDLDISQFLAEHTSFRAFPAMLGSIEFAGPGGMEATVAGLFRFVPNHGTAWTYARKMLARFFNAASRSAADPHSAAGRVALRRMAGEFFAVAADLGRVTGELHRALASGGPEDREFTPEPITPADVEAWLSGAERYVGELAGDIGRRLDAIPTALPAGIHGELAALVHESADLRGGLRGMRVLAADGAWKMRVHGDYHLGQVLRASNPEAAGGQWIVLDFEGEPARPLAERRSKQSPLRDVAGMLRSFDYAVQMAIEDYGTDDFMVRNSLHVWGGLWLETARAAFLESYRASVGESPFVPVDRGRFQTALDALELEKAIYELGYEMNNRPDWMWVPLRGIEAIRERAGA